MTDDGSHSIMPAHKRGPWSQAEDSVLLNLVHTQGAHNWVRISSLIQTRSPKQCRERYHQNLKPNLNHDPITAEEGALIEQMVAEMGKRWAEIARRLRGRSDNAVKNWWNGGQNRRRRNQQRRTDITSRETSGQMPPNVQQMMAQQHGVPDPAMYYNNGMQQRTFYETHLPAIYHQQAHMPPSIMVPQLNTAPMPRGGRFETPLPSPGAYSAALSDNGAPSMISDTSSGSLRSPHPYGMQSPIDLPPLSANSTNGGHRGSIMSNRLNVPGYQTGEDEYQVHMAQHPDGMKRPQMMQDAFNPYQMQGYPRNSHEFIQPQMQYAQHQSPLPHIYTQMDNHHQQGPPASMPYHNGPMSATAPGQMAQSPNGELRSPMNSIDPTLEHKAPDRSNTETPPRERMPLSSMINS